MSFKDLKVGDEVTRMLAGIIPQKLKVTEIVSEERMLCGWWEFSRTTGYEIDEDLQGPYDPETHGVTTPIISYLKLGQRQ